MATAKTKTTERELMLAMSLRSAIEQLDGWVAWKCPKKHVAEHQEFIANLRKVLEGPHEGYAAFIRANQSADAALRDQALAACLDVLLRMIPGYCKVAGVEQCTDAQHDDAIHRAAISVHGPDAANWPKPLLSLMSGKLA